MQNAGIFTRAQHPPPADGDVLNHKEVATEEENKDLLDQIAKRDLILSAFPPWFFNPSGFC